jgi:hypothetical protein
MKTLDALSKTDVTKFESNSDVVGLFVDKLRIRLKPLL